MCKLFQRIGISIPLSDMDVGNPERPHIKDYREISEKQNFCNQKHHSRTWEKSDLKNIDFIYMMNFGDVDAVAKYYSQFGIPIFIHLFGQYNIRIVHALIDLMLQCDFIHFICYSLTEYKIYYRLSYDCQSIHSRLHHIPFGLDKEEFQHWTGEIESVYTTCNDIHNRRRACNWDTFSEITKDLPSTLSGRNTEKVGGLGLLPFEELKQNYRKHRCYLSMGTIPAPYTLTLLEAMMTGCPTIGYDNGMGLADEGILSSDGSVGLVSSDIFQIKQYITTLLKDYAFAKEQSLSIQEKAITLFNMVEVSQKWAEILNESL